MTGMYAMHYAVSGCPIAAKNKVSGAQTKVWTYTSWSMYCIQQFHYDTCVDISVILNKFMSVPYIYHVCISSSSSTNSQN